MFKRYMFFILGLAAILVGYILLAGGDTVVAPLLLVAGYCVLVPIFLIRAFLVRKGE